MMVPSPGDQRARYFSMSLSAARICLAERIGVQRKGSFAFLRLPPELRDIFYTMVAACPPSGLVLHPSGPDKIEVSAATRNFSDPFSMLCTQGRWPELVLNPLSTIFNLSLVNKQIYEEFTPYFFQINTFQFAGVSCISVVSQTLPSSHAQNIRHVTFKYHPFDADSATEAFKWLASLENLQKLDVHIDEAAWKADYRSSEAINLLKLPGLFTLRKLRGLKVNFHGNCPEIAAVLKAEMEQPPKAPRSAPRKRKGKELTLGERKQPARAAKARKTVGS